jgi:hypothetical protein
VTRKKSEKSKTDGRSHRKNTGAPYRIVFMVENPFIMRVQQDTELMARRAARTLARDCDVFWHLLDRNGVTCSEGAFIGGRAYLGTDANETLKRRHRQGWEPE